MRPTVEDLQAIWLFTYSRSSFLDAAGFLAELDKAAPESPQGHALIDAAIMAYARPFTTCWLPPERKRVVPLKDVLPPQHLAEFHEHALIIRNTMIGHKDATPAKGYTATMVADKSCGLLLGFFEHLLIARRATSPRASIFELAWMLNEVPARGRLEICPRPGGRALLGLERGERPRYVR